MTKNLTGQNLPVS